MGLQLLPVCKLCYLSSTATRDDVLQLESQFDGRNVPKAGEWVPKAKISRRQTFYNNKNPGQPVPCQNEAGAQEIRKRYFAATSLYRTCTFVTTLSIEVKLCKAG
jgi:hypothetical protein